MKDNKLECFICKRITSLVFRIETDNDCWDLSGVCINCMQDKDLEKKIFLNSEEKIKENIKAAAELVDIWKSKLNELNALRQSQNS